MIPWVNLQKETGMMFWKISVDFWRQLNFLSSKQFVENVCQISKLTHFIIHQRGIA